MPIILESSEAQASTGFNILTVLYGDDKKSTSKASLENENQDVPVDEETVSDKIRRRSSRKSQRYQSSPRMSKIREESIIKPQRTSFLVCPQDTLKQLQEKHAELLATFRKSVETNREKLLKLGCATVDKTRQTVSPAKIEDLLNQMHSARVALSNDRLQLLGKLREKAFLKNRDRQLEERYTVQIRRENLNFLQMEVSLTGEKIDEILKQLALAKSRYESDLSKVVHVREKWCAVQNDLHAKKELLEEVVDANEEHQGYLCELWKMKKQLRQENLDLKKQCRIINNEPLLRKYDLIVAEIKQVTNYKKKFEEL